MLASPERLRRAGVFQRAYTSRKSIQTEYFILYVLPRQGKPAVQRKSPIDSETQAEGRESNSSSVFSQPKKLGFQRWPLVGFVISKKVIKSACKRNRVKRRMREAYRHLRSGEKEKKGVSSGESTDVIRSLQQWYALVWVINEKVLNANWDEICKKMEGSLAQASRKYGQRQSPQEERGSGR